MENDISTVNGGRRIFRGSSPRFLGFFCALSAGIAIAACTGGPKASEEPTFVRLSGTVVDWSSGAPVGAASIRTVGITPQSQAESAVDGTFTISGIPINGYVILDVSAVGFERTLSPTLLVAEEDLEGVTVEIISNPEATNLIDAFGVVSSDGHGVVVGRTVDSQDAGIPDVAAIQVLPVTFDSDGPYFLDGVSPAPGATATLESGGFIFFNVSEGNIAVQAAAAGFVFQPTASVVRNGAWSVVRLEAEDGATPTPTPTGTPPPQSFSADIVPIFTSRGCNGANGCHRTGQPAGGLRLDQAANQIYPGVVQRVDLATPANSRLLTKPLFEAEADHTGGNIFETTSDPDYLKILWWIEQGALEN